MLGFREICLDLEFDFAFCLCGLGFESFGYFWGFGFPGWFGLGLTVSLGIERVWVGISWNLAGLDFWVGLTCLGSLFCDWLDLSWFCFLVDRT